MKILKSLTLMIALATAVCACEKAPEGEQLPSNVKADLNFKLEVTELAYNSIQIRVQHDGTTDDTWYGFLTDKTDKQDVILIAEKIAELTATGEIQGLEKRTTKRVEFSELEAATKYRYIVFAITPDGQPYGNMASLDITTPEGFLLKTVDDWTLAYEGRDAATNKERYSLKFEKNGAARCHVGFIPKWMVESYEQLDAVKQEIEQYGGLRLQIGEDIVLFTVLDYLVFEELYEFWGYYDEDESYFTQETFAESAVFELPRQESGDYYAVAIGFNDGAPTWTYSVDEVTVVKETASSSYNNWLGDWELTGANDITYFLTFEENDPNYSYFVYGWECSKSLHNDKCEEGCKEHVLYADFSEFELGIPFYFDAIGGDLLITSKVLGGEQSSGDSYIYWGMFGYTEHEGEKVAILTPEDNIATAKQAADFKTTLKGLESVTYKYGTDNSVEEVKFTYNSLGYVRYDDQTYTPSPWNLPLELPATMVKAYSQPAAKAISKDNGSMRHEMAAKSFKTIKANDYTKLKTAR